MQNSAAACTGVSASNQTRARLPARRHHAHHRSTARPAKRAPARPPTATTPTTAPDDDDDDDDDDDPNPSVRPSDNEIHILTNKDKSEPTNKNT